jgi:single-stranded DNA-specific DHH superfamily exonuclease
MGKKNSILHLKISFEDLHPLDKMKLTHATALINIANELETYDSDSLKALGIYFKHCKAIYETFHDNDKSITER